jgi:hypothetical protein
VDPGGISMANPIETSAQGFIPAFQVTIPHVKWFDGTYAGYLSSYKGLLDEAIAAREAAEQAAISNIPSGGEVGQVLMKASATNGHTYWGTPIVIIGPEDDWPTGLPEGTLVLRTET